MELLGERFIVLVIDVMPARRTMEEYATFIITIELSFRRISLRSGRHERSRKTLRESLERCYYTYIRTYVHLLGVPNHESG